MLKNPKIIRAILFLINSVCPLLYSWVCKDNFEVIYQTQKTLNYHISKHCDVEWTQIFNELPGVWKYDNTMNRVCISSQSKPTLTKQDDFLNRVTEL